MPVSKAVVDVSRDRLCEGLALGRAGIERSLSEELLWPPQSLPPTTFPPTLEERAWARESVFSQPGLPVS